MIAQPHRETHGLPENAASGLASNDPDVPVPRTEVNIKPDPLLRLELRYPQPGTARLCVSGEVDLTNTTRLGEQLKSRLRTELQLLVLDLSRLTFLSVSGSQMLAHAAQFATTHGTELRILIGDSRAVRRALLATGTDRQLPLHGSSA